MKPSKTLCFAILVSFKRNTLCLLTGMGKGRALNQFPPLTATLMQWEPLELVGCIAAVPLALAALKITNKRDRRIIS